MFGALIKTFKNASATLAALALAAGFAPSANASFSFTPSGDGGTTYTTSGLGFGPGNALAVSSVPLTVGSTFQTFFQTHLTSLAGVNFVAGLNQSFQVTEVATFTEVVTSVTTTAGGTTATFALVPNSSNNISIYENNAVVFNDAAGTGFTAGNKIASLSATSFIASNFTEGTGLGTFNQTGAGNNSGTGLSVTGSGSSSIAAGVVTTDAGFFKTPGLSSSIVNLGINSIFDTVSPSLLFTNPITSATVVPNIGAINGGTGPDFQFQVSGFTQSFTAAVVPEPASVAMTLIGFGGAGLGAFLNRRKKSAVSAA